MSFPKRGARAGSIIEPARGKGAMNSSLEFIATALSLQSAHLLGQHPQRAVQVDATVDAAHRPRLHPSPLDASARLASPQHISLQAVHRNPQAVPKVSLPWEERVEQIVDGVNEAACPPRE